MLGKDADIVTMRAGLATVAVAEAVLAVGAEGRTVVVGSVGRMTTTEVSAGDAGTAATPPSRLAYIGYLRVLAILGVVAIHVAGLTVIRPALSHTTVWWVAEALNQCTRWAVPMFVMVSGALVLRPSAMEVPLGRYYRKRLGRIVPALVAWHVVYIVFELASVST